MIKFAYTLTPLLGVFVGVCVFTGCADSGFENADEYFIKVGNRVVTALDFNKTFEITKAAYPNKLLQNPVFIKEAQLRLVNQMVEEMVLQTRAEELNIAISDSEVEKAVADIKKDYPARLFEQTLLEQAVSYTSWEKGLKVRLLMEKVVAKELREQITITSEDIAKYYGEYCKRNSAIADLKERPDDINEDINAMLIQHIRREKMENVYKPWIKNLKKKYIIAINQVQWEKINGL